MGPGQKNFKERGGGDPCGLPGLGRVSLVKFFGSARGHNMMKKRGAGCPGLGWVFKEGGVQHGSHQGWETGGPGGLLDGSFLPSFRPGA